MFWMKVIKTPEAILVNICDEELLGKTFREGEVVLRVTSSFYGGEKVDEEKVKEMIEEGDIISLVGERSIGVAISLGYAVTSAVKKVQGVPHLNIYKL